MRVKSLPIPLICACLSLAGPAAPAVLAQAGAKKAKAASVLDDSSGNLAKLAEMILGKNGGDRLFYFPSKDQPCTPRKFGYQYEDVSFRSADGTKLHGWFMPAAAGAGKAKGTVVFSHGNAGSLGHHLGFVSWLMRAGYNVLLYDYRGYGKSSGTVSRKGIIEDVQAAFAYVAKRKDVDATRLVSFSHSLGGAKSIAAIGMKPVKGLRAVIVDGGFASYRDMARLKAGELGAKMTSDEFSAIQYVDKISPVPILFVHGENDTMVPISQGEKLFKKAKKPKTFFRVRGGSHTDSLGRNHGEYRKKMLAWLDKVLR